MIKTYRNLKDCLKIEKKLYIPYKKIDRVLALITGDYTQRIWKWQRMLRLSEFFLNNSVAKNGREGFVLYDFLYVISRWIRNHRAVRLNIEIWENCFEQGLLIYHSAGGIGQRVCEDWEKL